MTLKQICLFALMMPITLLDMHAMASEGDIVVAVSGASRIESISKRELIDVFMGRFDVLQNGERVQPVDYSGNPALRGTFYQRLVGKNQKQINAYWSRLVFSGRAKPPVQVDSVQQSIRFILDNPTGLAYLPASRVSEEMKIVLVLE
ncbi:hypothetical protein [Alteromonas gilva]|uniref:Phosphate ABC transporter substrate-binding protein n=1 Tax=Alteromonas gilva TaxID=2987522 RepID=A0ABT5KYS7_9ALTE|nr:hypothetical protein [Alteromonas gilva]MDC8829925.1 hypothetical protein [Alteromonas gilva]